MPGPGVNGQRAQNYSRHESERKQGEFGRCQVCEQNSHRDLSSESVVRESFDAGTGCPSPGRAARPAQGLNPLTIVNTFSRIMPI